MPASSRQLNEADRRCRRQAVEVGGEFRERRLVLNASQDHVAGQARMSRKHYGKIERGESPSLSLQDMNRIAAILGLTPSVKLYPDGIPVRDAGHASRIASFLALAQPPITHRVEVALPVVEGRAERRAWDVVLFRERERCAVELEMQLRDVQALKRRIDLKRRDDPTDSFLLLIADTRHNRRVLAEFAGLFADLPRLRPSRVRAALAAGELPPSGILLV